MSDAGIATGPPLKLFIRERTFAIGCKLIDKEKVMDLPSLVQGMLMLPAENIALTEDFGSLPSG